MHWKRCPLLTLVLAMVFVVFSGPALARPFADLLAETVNGHDLVKAAEARRDGAKARISYAQGERMPHLEAVANVGPERIDFPGDAKTTSEVRDMQSVSARQLLFDFGRSGAGISRAQAGLERAEAELTAVRQEILLRGITACLDVLRHRERLRLAQESEKRIIQQTGIEETLVTKGAGLASDVLQAKSQLAGARAQLARVEGQLAAARNRFVTVFGLEPTEEFLAGLEVSEAPFGLAPSSQAEASDAALSTSVEVQVARFNVDMARQDVAGAKAGYYPRLHLVGEVERQHDDQGIDGTRTELRGLVEMTWDVFSGGKQQALTREARSALTDHELRLDDLRKRVEERVADAWQEMLTTRENARLLRDQAQILEAFLELAKRERLLGTRSLLDVLNGEVGHLNAQSNAVSAETDRAIALYSLFHAMGKLDLDLMR